MASGLEYLATAVFLGGLGFVLYRMAVSRKPDSRMEMLERLMGPGDMLESGLKKPDRKTR